MNFVININRDEDAEKEFNFNIGENTFHLLKSDGHNYVLGLTLDIMEPNNTNILYLNNVFIGRNSAIARENKFLIDRNHDYNFVCQGYVKYLENYNKPVKNRQINRKGEIVIENDCWLGNGVTVMSGIVMGNGSAVGAKSVVTRSVPPYAIVGGNPAKIIKYRFEKDVIDKLLKIQWWYWPEKILKERIDDMVETAKYFVEKHIEEAEERIEKAIKNPPFERFLKSDTYVCIADTEKFFPAIYRILEQFGNNFPNEKAALYIYFNPKTVMLPENISKFYNAVAKCATKGCYVMITDKIYSVESLVLAGDYVITTRADENVELCSYAHMGMSMGITKGIISGFSTDMFSKSMA